ncbi:iron dependent repressor, metal binding and dimerization domain protein [Methanocaldococcus sp.]
MDKEIASKEACKLEHAMSDEVLKKLKIFMEEHKDLVE